MPCPGATNPSRAGAQLEDLLQLHASVANRLYVPGNKAELIAAVAAATKEARPVRALGSGYSLSGLQVAEDVIDTSGAVDPAPGERRPLLNEYPNCPGLQMHLCQPFPRGTAPIDQRRMRDGGHDLLANIGAKNPQAVANRHFVHVEAGIKFRWLLQDLGLCGLALPTMGAGGGQSLAGALSTATHGGDFMVPPLVEWVRAVHLVAPGGREWWITPKGSIFGDKQLLRALPGWCPDTHIVANNRAFDAVRVGAGRTGVVYSMILEVVAAYSLVEVNLVHRRDEIVELLKHSGIVNGKATGIFDTTFDDLDGGWFRSEILSRTLITTLGQNEFRYFDGPSNHVEPPEDAYRQRYYLDELNSLGLTDVAAKLRGGKPTQLRHLNIVVPLTRSDRCWVTRRWRRDGLIEPAGLAPASREPVVAAAIANRRNPLGIVPAFQKKMDEGGDILTTINVIDKHGIHGTIKLKHLQDHFRDVEVPRIARQSADAGTTSMEAIFILLYRLATYPVLSEESMAVVATAVTEIIGSDFSKIVRAGPASGGLHGNVLDVHDYELDGAQSGNSAEFFFDAAQPHYLGFLEEIIRSANAHLPVFGLIGVRFTPRSTALIAMQQFELTVAVEIQTGRSRLDDVHAGFWNDVHKAANDYGGIAHWGQEFRQTEHEVSQRYGERLVTWRLVLGALAAGHPDTFSTKFSRAHGLEPLPGLRLLDDDAIDLFFQALDGATDGR